MDFKDYYKVLNLEEKATADEIKRAYRKLARKYHPDVSKEENAEAQFKEVSEAYEVLKDPEKREAYDELRRSPYRHGQQFEPPPDWHFDANFRGGGFTEATGGFSDFFSTIFGDSMRGNAGNRRGSTFSGRGEDLHDRLTITLEEAVAGTSRQLRLSLPQMDASGRSTMSAKTLNVKVPAGVTSGRRIRLRGQGAPGFGGGSAGDLYLEISIAPHPLYLIDGRDITLTLPITPWEAALGSTVKVPTLSGQVELKIPPDSQTGGRLRLRGKGMPGKPPGDQFVILKVVAPPADTPDKKEFYKRMQATFDFNPRTHLDGGR